MGIGFFSAGCQARQHRQAARSRRARFSIGKHAQAVIGSGDAGAYRQRGIAGLAGVAHQLAMQAGIAGSGGGQHACNLPVYCAATRRRQVTVHGFAHQVVRKIVIAVTAGF